ncbi:hypothetical protein HPAKL86_05950 [Helicobacter pylori Aklavik86]|uniref:Uncharacterized protein n=1 Tax=Helicobacter pylori Aklavik86 TaxID=1055532 RepID=K7Y393_HELPX|nr:hypothetical protein HPAKL86_05950 [Helicobacter pylori Aklavik86]
MLLNYDFLEFVDEPQRNTSLTSAIDKALADKKLARQNKPRVKIKEGLSLRATLDAFGDELSRLKNAKDTTIKGSTIESASLNSIVKKIQSGLPFGTISAFRPFKEAFIKDFTEKERELLIKAYKSGYKVSQLDKVAKKWNDDPNPIDFYYLADAFLREYRTIALKLSTALGKSFVSKFLNPKSEATMKDLMSSKEFVKRYRYTQKDNMERTQQLKKLLDSKRDFIGYIQVIGYWKDDTKDDLIPDKEVSFFVFVNEPSSTFYLRKHLLLWATQFNQAAICYCQNSVYNNKDRYYVELVNALPERFGKVEAKFTDITFSVPKELPHSLTRLQNKVYTFFKKEGEDNYGISFEDIVKTQIKATYMPYTIGNLTDTFENEIKGFIKRTQSRVRAYGYPKTFNVDEIENWEQQAIKTREQRKCAMSKRFRQSYNHNIKVNNLVNAMLKGKKVSRTLVANTIDTDAGYCFISPTDLATQLNNISPRL